MHVWGHTGIAVPLPLSRNTKKKFDPFPHLFTTAVASIWSPGGNGIEI